LARTRTHATSAERQAAYRSRQHVLTGGMLCFLNTARDFLQAHAPNMLPDGKTAKEASDYEIFLAMESFVTVLASGMAGQEE